MQRRRGRVNCKKGRWEKKREKRKKGSGQNWVNHAIGETQKKKEVSRSRGRGGGGTQGGIRRPKDKAVPTRMKVLKGGRGDVIRLNNRRSWEVQGGGGGGLLCGCKWSVPQTLSAQTKYGKAGGQEKTS